MTEDTVANRTRPMVVNVLAGLIWLAAGHAAPRALAAEPGPTAPGTVVLFTDGDFLSGSLIDSTEEGIFRLQSPVFTAPLRFRADSVRSIQFPVANKLPAPEGQYCFELAGADVLYGSLTSLDADKAVIDVPGLGPLHVERAIIRRFYRWNKDDLIFSGPSGLKGWQIVGDAKTWREDGAHFVTDHEGAVIRGDFRAPPLARYEVELSWSSKPDFVLALGVGEEPETAQRAFRFEVWDNELIVRRETEREADVAALQPIAAGPGRVRFQAFLDQQNGKILVFSAAGQQLAELNVVNDKSPSPPKISTARPQMLLRVPTGRLPSLGGVQLTNRRGDVRLERLTIGRWYGERPHVAGTDKATVYSADGAAAHGELKSYDPAKREFVLVEAGTDRRMSEDQVLDVVLSQAEEASQPAARAVDLSGMRISGNLLRVEQHQVWLQSPGIQEPLGLPLEGLQSLIVLRHEGGVAVPRLKDGRLESAGALLHGRFVERREGDDGCLVWQSRHSDTPAALARGVAARVVYRDRAPPPTPQPQRQSTVDAPAGGIARLALAPVRTLLGLRAAPSKPQPTKSAPVLHLRTGDTIACTETSINEQGITFRTELADATFVAHEQLQALELMPNAEPVSIFKLKKERLLMLPRMQRENPPTQLIRSVDGDYLRGRLVSMDDKQLQVEVRLETQAIPRGSVARIIWLHPEETAAASPAGQADPPAGTRVQAVPSDGNRLTFFAEQLAGTTLSGRSEILGSCHVNLEQVDELLIGAAIEQSAATLAFHQWKLTSAAEPLVNEEPPADGGEGLESVLVGKPAPDFELDLLDGAKFHLADHQHKVLVLDFWASWCGPCLQVMPQIDRVVQEFTDQHVELVTINLQETPDQIKTAVERLQLHRPIALDRDGLVAEKYGVTAIPQTVVIDADGKVARLFVGGSARFDEQLRGALNSVLNPALPVKPTSEGTPP